MLVMPKEYYGGSIEKTEYTKTQPRKWTEEEIKWCKERVAEGYSYKEIAKAVNRTDVSVSLKMKREKKKDNKYNLNYRDKKYDYNKKFIELTQPHSVLDCFTGVANYYSKCLSIPVVLTNDIDTTIKATYHMDYLKLLCQEYAKGSTFDVIDLDPFGSAYDGFDLAIKMANKGIVITFGEMGAKRWKRLDYVASRYDIHSIKEFTLDNLIKKVQAIGLRNKKELTPVFRMKEQLIGRVWFTITPAKPNKPLVKNNKEEYNDNKN